MKATRTCSIAGCDRSGKLSRGWCAMHYARWRKTGETGPVESSHRQVCSMEDCNRPHFGHGYCTMHWSRFYRHGDASVVLPHLTGICKQFVANYAKAHDRLRWHRGPAKDHPCADCGGTAAHWAYDLLDPDEQTDVRTGQRFSSKPEHYRPLCIPCHWTYDNHPAQKGAVRLNRGPDGKFAPA